MPPIDLMTGIHSQRGLLYIALSALATFVLLVAFLHFVRGDHDPISQPLSEYAIGQWGILLSGSLFALALGSNAVVLLLISVVPKSRAGKAGLALLAAWGVGAFLAGAFPTDPPAGDRTIAGTIHVVASLIAFVSVVAGINILSVSGAILAASGSYRRIAKGLGYLAATLFVLLFALIPVGWGGLGQRLLVGVILGWLTLTALHVADSGEASS